MTARKSAGGRVADTTAVNGAENEWLTPETIDPRLARLFAILERAPEAPQADVGHAYQALLVVIANALQFQRHPPFKRTKQELALLTKLSADLGSIRAALDDPVISDAFLAVHRFRRMEGDPRALHATCVEWVEAMQTVAYDGVCFSARPRGRQTDGAQGLVRDATAEYLQRYGYTVDHTAGGVYKQCLAVLLPMLGRHAEHPDVTASKTNSAIKRRKQLTRKKK